MSASNEELQARVEKLEEMMSQMLVHKHQSFPPSMATPMPYRYNTTRPVGMGSVKP